MQDVPDDLAGDMSKAVDESECKEQFITLVEVMERKAKDRANFYSLVYGLLEYLTKRIE